MDALKEIVKLLEAATEMDVCIDDISDSPVADYGSPIAFKLAKDLKKNPLEIAKEICGKIKPCGVVSKVDEVNGYINFFLDRAVYTRQLLDEIHEQKDSYGGNISKGKIILEHTSVNPTGPVHVGRLRNTIIGDSIGKVLSFAGYDVETHYYVNVIGREIAIIALGKETGINPDEKVISNYPDHKEKKDFQMFALYVPSFKRFEEDESFKDEVFTLIKKAESGDKDSLKKITDIAKDCLIGQLESYKRMGISFDIFDYESDSIVNGTAFDIIEKASKSSYWVQEDFGKGLDLSSFGIEKKSGMSVLARGDGTTVYLSRDLAYHLEKEKLSKDGRIINVLGEDHKLEFTELKTILVEILDFKAQLESVHYSFVSFEGEKFSTRKGNIASVDMLLDEAVEKALTEVKKRNMADESIAPKVGIGAVKFHIIKYHPNKQITFKWSDALDFEGETAPYIQYAYARSCRIIEKAGKLDDLEYDSMPENDEEWDLIKLLADFPIAIQRVVDELRPDILATYLLTLTAAYGRFYMKCPVLESDEEVRSRRIMIVKSVRDIIMKGLDLLGIDAPDRM